VRVIDFLVGLAIGIAALTFLARNRHKTWSYVIVLIWLGMVALTTFTFGGWWRWLALAVWIWVVYDWRKPMRKKKGPTTLDHLVVLSDLYAQCALATMVLAMQIETHAHESHSAEGMAELLTELGDDMTAMHGRLAEAIKQVATAAKEAEGDQR
jgi:ABC-type dipeptide/oligopeptide/nickel transport system permease component